MSRHIGWPERHGFHSEDLRRLANILEQLDREEPLVGMRWTVDVVAPMQVWDIDPEAP